MDRKLNNSPLTDVVDVVDERLFVGCV